MSDGSDSGNGATPVNVGGNGTLLGGNIEAIEIQEEMERSFLDYAMSVIMQRALPDARDGLKPVHRRILYAMHELGLRPDRPRMKSARVSGEVMGKFHPHGEGSIYDALVRMAQPFALRDPLIDFHGNYGSPDFSAAASRYCVTGETRVRLACGTSPAIGDLVALAPNSEADVDFDVLDQDGKPVRAVKVFHSGTHPTTRVTTKLGFSIRGTHNHPLLCLVDDGIVWRTLAQLESGTIVCLATHAWADIRPTAADFRVLEDIAPSERGLCPPDVWTADWGVKRAFVERLFGGDEVATCVSSADARDVQELLAELGIVAARDGSHLRMTAERFGTGYRFDEIVAVEECPSAEVFSLKVDTEDHSFLAGGFVNHNTEARLATLASEMLAGIDEDTVDFAPNYTNEFQEPTVLPSRFPNLLVNGSQGIAVGMATNIPPHNLGEVIDAVNHLIDHPEATPDDLMEFVRGPDFPTGALILGRAGIIDAYRTGRGSIRMRARAEIDETKTGVQIVVTELPYQASMATITTRIADLVNGRELDGIRSVDDLSAGDDTKLVIGLKRDANANVVLNNLFKQTGLQTSFGVNMVALVDGVPRTLNLVQALHAYIDHQVDVITRRSKFRLKKAEDRAHIVEGLIKALDKIDAIIKLIRGSDDRGAARDGLMAKPFNFSEIQANHILDMRLVMLTRLNGAELKDEMKKLQSEIAELEATLRSPAKLRGVIKAELGEIREKFATPRRAEITFDPGDIGIEDLIDDEPVVFTMTRAGYVKTTQAGQFRTQGRGGRGVQGANLKEEDIISAVVHTTAHAYLLFFSNRGRVFRLKAHEIPMKDRTARGTAIVNLLPLANDEKIQAVIDTREYGDDEYLFFATKKGQVKKTVFSEYDKSRREGFIAIGLKQGDELVRVIRTVGADDIFMVTRLGHTTRFSNAAVRPTGRGAQGVIGMRLRGEDEVVSCDVARDDAAILIITDAGYGKRIQLDKFTRKGRGTMGVQGIKLTAKKGYVVAAFMVGLDDEVFLVTSSGVTARIPVREISSQGRAATGVRLQRVDVGATVASAAPIITVEEPDPQESLPV